MRANSRTTCPLASAGLGFLLAFLALAWPAWAGTVDLLIERLDSESRGERMAAMKELKALGADGRRAIPRLVETIRSADLSSGKEFVEAQVAGNALVGIGADAVPQLLDLGGDPNPKVRAVVSPWIEELKPATSEVADAMLNDFEDSDTAQKLWRLKGYAALEPDRKRKVGRLAAYLNHQDEEIAAYVAGLIAEQGMDGFPFFVELANSDPWLVGEGPKANLLNPGSPIAAAYFGLQEIGVTALDKAIESWDGLGAGGKIVALVLAGGMAQDDPALNEAFMVTANWALFDHHPKVILLALEFVERLEWNDRILSRVTSLLDLPDPDLQYAAVDVLVARGAVTSALHAKLEELTKADNRDLSWRAAAALIETGGPMGPATEILVGLIDEGADLQQNITFTFMGRSSGHDTTWRDVLHSALESDDPPTRAAAFRGLGSQRPASPETMDLTLARREDPHILVRLAIVEAIRNQAEGFKDAQFPDARALLDAVLPRLPTGDEPSLKLSRQNLRRFIGTIPSE